MLLGVSVPPPEIDFAFLQRGGVTGVLHAYEELFCRYTRHAFTFKGGQPTSLPSGSVVCSASSIPLIAAYGGPGPTYFDPQTSRDPVRRHCWLQRSHEC